ncbi:hypothetical protein R0K20_18965, partial [Staphylococcus sp. SIMBA_130]
TFEGLGQVVEGKASPQLELSIGGRSETSHKMTVEIGPTVNNLRELGQYTFEEFENYVLAD